MLGRLKNKLFSRARRVTKAPSDTHFELINSSELFDADWYLASYPDVKNSGLEPAQHYLSVGAQQGRNPSTQFDTQFYLERYADVEESGINPLVHYLLHGQHEGRHPCEDELELLEDKIWSGHAPTATKKLLDMLENEATSRVARSQAAWQLARWYGFKGQFKEALQLAYRMREFEPLQRLAKHRVLLEASCLLKLSRDQEAAAILTEFLAVEPNDPDARLLLANTCERDEERLACINEMYERQGFAPVSRCDQSKPLCFANLCSDWAADAQVIAEPQQHEKISIIMPIFEAEERVEIAVRSLLNQTWRNIEIIAVDDCSKDGTVAILQRLADEDERVKVIQQPHNQGAYPARNRGLREASGDLITTHDADDWSHPQKLEQQVTLLRESPSAKGVILSWVRATDDLHFTINWRPSDAIIHYSHSSFMLAREAVDAIGPWDEVRISADTEWIWRAQHHFGKASIRHGLSKVPMAFALDDEGSLTRTKATHVSTVYFGLRHIYREICRWYHQQGLEPTKKTTLPIAMKQRGQQQQHFDVILVADFCAKKPAKQWARDVRELTEQGQKVALLHWPSFDKRWQRFASVYFELLHEGLAQPVVFGDDVSAARVVVYDLRVLAYPVVATPNFNGVSSVELRKLSDFRSDGEWQQTLADAKAEAKRVFNPEEMSVTL